MSQLSFFDFSDRMESLALSGDPLLKLDSLIPWESFRKPILRALRNPFKRSTGRPPYDVVLMFKILILQTLYNLSDDQTEF